MRKRLTFLKTLIAAVAVIVLFTACKQLLDDPEDFLSFWASEAFIKDRSIGSAHRPDGAGVPCVGSSDNVLITLTAHNPKNFPFVMPSSSKPAGIVEFKELSHQPAAGADYELKQTGSGTLELTYKQDFLKRYEQGSAALNPTITLKAKDGRVFKQTYTFGIKSNTPPPKPKEIVLAKTKITGTETISYYVLCLQFDSAEMTKKVTIGSGTVPIHKDIAKITINDSPYTLLYKEDNSDFQKPAETFSIGSFIESENVEILDSSSPDVPSGWVLYFKTGIQVQSTNPQTSYTITLSDNKGVISDVFTAELKKKFKVTFNSQDGSPVPAQYIENNGKVTRPTNPTKTGYIFGGWYKNDACSGGQEWNFANEIVTGDITLYAKWTAGSGTQYKVEHYQQKLDDSYPVAPTDTDNETGTTGASAAYTLKTYEGFTYESTLTNINGIQQTSGNIAGDGSTVVKLYYKRNEITVTFNLNGGNIGGDPNNVIRTGKFGKPLTAPTAEREGYTFSGWNPTHPAPALPSTFPAVNAEYTAQWTAGEVSYKVEHYQQKLDDSYPVAPTDTDTPNGTTGENAAYTPKTYEGFTYESTLTTINGTVQQSGTINADGTTVVKLYYKRKIINVTFDPNGGNIGGNTGTVTRRGKYGALLTVPSPQLQGKTLSGWSPALPSPPTFPAEDATYTAQWTANTYYVHFYGNGNTGGSMSDQTFTYGQSQQLSANGFTKTGHTFDGWAIIAGGSKVYDNQQSVINLTDVQNGTVNLYAVWKINTYTVTFSVDGGHGTISARPQGGFENSTGSVSVEHGKNVTFTAHPDNGWEVDSWSSNVTVDSSDNKKATLSNITETTNKTVTVKFKPGELHFNSGGSDAWKRLKEEVEKTEGAHTIVINGEITATNDQGNNGKISIRRELIIKSSGSSASLNASNLSGIFDVNNKLTLENITLKNGTEPGSRTGAGAYVDSTLIMKGSSAITNCSAHKGGGVYVNNGTLIMQGSSTITNCEANDGGGVYVNGTFKMEGSAIVTPSTSGDENVKGKNDVYLESGKSITVTGSLNHHPAARITPNSYTDGRVLATGAAEKANFKVTPQDGNKYWRFKKQGGEVKFVPAKLKVTFNKIKCVEEHDDGPNGEYYWTMKVDGIIVHERPKNNLWVAGDNTTLPINKSFTRSFSYFPASIPVDIEIWEHDDSFDDHVGTTKAHLTYNYDDDQWKWAYDGGNWNTNPKRNEMSNPNVIIGDGGEEIFTEEYRTNDGDTDVTITISWKE